MLTTKSAYYLIMRITTTTKTKLINNTGRGIKHGIVTTPY